MQEYLEMNRHIMKRSGFPDNEKPKRRYSMEKKEERSDIRKTISIEENLLKRPKKQEKNRYGKNKAEENSSAHMWAELYI